MKKEILILTALLFIVSCSSENIDTTIKEGNEGFVIGNGSIGVLLTHGLGASPYEIKELSEFLAEKGFTVYAVRLDGHGTSLEDLKRTKWESWYDNYQRAYVSMKNTKEKVFVGGMSLGGLLALKLAEDEDTAGVIALAPAVVLDDKRSNYAWFFKYFTKYSSRTLNGEQKNYYYQKFPVASVAEMVELAGNVRKNLEKINEPVLVMQHSSDYRVSPESSEIVYDSVSSSDKELIWIDGNSHVFIVEEGKEAYFEQIYNFILSKI